MKPLVSIICLCYNHAAFVRQAVESVIQQSYNPMQIIVADDASSDGSVAEIEKLKAEYPFLELFLLPRNVGNCKAFNAAFGLVKGDFVIDFATDDLMMSDRIEKQMKVFETVDQTVGLVYTDAIYINEEGSFLRNHFEYLFQKRLISSIPQGDVYREVLSTYFIPGPTMMVRREVFDVLGGYDESLAYEDFDFWVRSSRYYRYAFLNEKLTGIRKVRGSMSAGWYVPGDKQLHSTYLVCKKAELLNRDDGDKQALVVRVRYEFRQSVISGNYSEAMLFFALLEELKGVRLVDSILLFANQRRIPLSALRRWYHKVRFS